MLSRLCLMTLLGLIELEPLANFGNKVLEMATATYQPPPPYYKLYKDYLQDPKSAPEPLPPIEGTYICYGATYTTDDVLPSLEEQGTYRLVNCTQKAQILILRRN
ncbi:hypothetical protein ABKV19_020659 [Rosa sericea]